MSTMGGIIPVSCLPLMNRHLLTMNRQLVRLGKLCLCTDNFGSSTTEAAFVVWRRRKALHIVMRFVR